MGSGMSCFQINEQHKVHDMNQLSVHQMNVQQQQYFDDDDENSISPARKTARQRNKHLKAQTPPPRSSYKYHKKQSKLTIHRHANRTSTKQPKRKCSNNHLTLPAALKSTRSVSSNISCLSPYSAVSSAHTAMSAVSQLSALSPAVSSSFSDHEQNEASPSVSIQSMSNEQSDDHFEEESEHSSSETSLSLTLDHNETSVSTQSSDSCDGYSPIEPTFETEYDPNVKILSPTMATTLHHQHENDHDSTSSSSESTQEFYESDFDVMNDENECNFNNSNHSVLTSYKSISKKEDLILTEKRESYLSQMSAISSLSTLRQNGESNSKMGAFGLSYKISQFLKRNKNKKGKNAKEGGLTRISSRSNTMSNNILDEFEEESASSSTTTASTHTLSLTSGEEYQVYGDVEYKHVNIDVLRMCLAEDEEEYYYEDNEEEEYVD